MLSFLDLIVVIILDYFLMLFSIFSNSLVLKTKVSDCKLLLRMYQQCAVYLYKVLVEKMTLSPFIKFRCEKPKCLSFFLGVVEGLSTMLATFQGFF